MIDTIVTFANADLVAVGLPAFNPETAAMRAGRLMVQLINEHVARGDSFAFETTLTDKSDARHLRSSRGDASCILGRDEQRPYGRRRSKTFLEVRA